MPDELEIPYAMPPLQQYDYVLFYEEANTARAGILAYAEQVNANNVVLVLMAPERPFHRTQLGARHVSDPDLKSKPNVKFNNGGWDYLPQHKALAASVERIERLIGLGAAPLGRGAMDEAARGYKSETLPLGQTTITATRELIQNPEPAPKKTWSRKKGAKLNPAPELATASSES